MLGPYKCNCCGEVFDEPSTYFETHGFTDGLYERFSCCPNCGGDYHEVEDDEEVDDDC